MSSRPILATKLSPGDKIGIVSPSDCPAAGDPKLARGMGYLQELGFRAVLGPHAESDTLRYAAAPRDKAEDIHQFFADPSIRAIFCSQGGDTANACLPYLDWALIAEHPKIFLGISDITVLLNAIYTRTGLITFHGNDVMWGFGRDPSAYDTREFLARLAEARIGEIPAHGQRRAIRSGIAEGRLLGGNLKCLMKLAGTPYFPDFSGSILFLESIAVSPAGCDALLRQLEQIGVFGQVRGVLTGYIDGMDNDPAAAVHFHDILLDVTKAYGFPILKADDFGHNCANTLLPVGAMVRIDAAARRIEILEDCLRSAD